MWEKKKSRFLWLLGMGQCYREKSRRIGTHARSGREGGRIVDLWGGRNMVWKQSGLEGKRTPARDFWGLRWERKGIVADRPTESKNGVDFSGRSHAHSAAGKVNQSQRNSETRKKVGEEGDGATRGV